MTEVPIHKRPKVRRIMRQGVADVIKNSVFYDQSQYGAKSKANPCETECCLAGFIDWKANPKVHNDSIKFHQGGVEYRAKLIMGIQWSLYIPPFMKADCWPEKFADRFQKANGDRAKQALVLKARVEHWFKTGE